MSELEFELIGLEKYYSQRKKKRILRFLIIGLFIGRNLDRMIYELETKIAARMEKYVSDSSKIFEEVAKSGTYLVFSQKQKYLSELKTITQAIEICEKQQHVYSRMVAKTKDKIEFCKEFIINYNTNFVKERKLAYRHLWNTGKFFLDNEQQTAIIQDDKYRAHKWSLILFCLYFGN